MYDEMTIADLLVTAHQKAHPEDQPSSENALLIDELARRLRRLDNWRSKVSAEINPYLTDDDGSDLLPEPERIRNMLKRLSSAQAAPVPILVSERLPGPEDCDAEERCWLLVPRWILPPFELTYWLPFNALPLPTTEPTP